MDPPRIDQFTGSLIGQCLGDALGSPVEGQPPAVCQPASLGPTAVSMISLNSIPESAR